MDEVLKRAEELAAAIQVSDRYTKLREVEKRLADDTETQELTKEYEEAREKIAEKEGALQPVEVEEKRAFAVLEERIKQNEGLRELMEVRADYFEMMNRVNSTLQSTLGG